MSIAKLDITGMHLQISNIFDKWIPKNPKKKKIALGRFLPSCRFHGGVFMPNFKCLGAYHVECGLREAYGARTSITKPVVLLRNWGVDKNEMTSFLIQPYNLSPKVIGTRHIITTVMTLIKKLMLHYRVTMDFICFLLQKHPIS